VFAISPFLLQGIIIACVIVHLSVVDLNSISDGARCTCQLDGCMLVYLFDVMHRHGFDDFNLDLWWCTYAHVKSRGARLVSLFDVIVYIWSLCVNVALDQQSPHLMTNRTDAMVHVLSALVVMFNLVTRFNSLISVHLLRTLW
jgi:hypothetical protein